MEQKEKSIKIIFDLFEKYGSKDYIGEPVPQTEHMIQAAMLAEKDNQSPRIILAALFHDIGHLLGLENKTYETMGNVGVKNHEKLGRQFLENHGIPEPIPFLVEKHVNAKRYLCFKEKDYLKNLSSGSKKTLFHQGGPMTKEEAEKFEKNEYFKEILLLRGYDEKAKSENMKINNLSYYKKMLKEILT